MNIEGTTERRNDAVEKKKKERENSILTLSKLSSMEDPIAFYVTPAPRLPKLSKSRRLRVQTQKNERKKQIALNK